MPTAGWYTLGVCAIGESVLVYSSRWINSRKDLALGRVKLRFPAFFLSHGRMGIPIPSGPCLCALPLPRPEDYVWHLGQKYVPLARTRIAAMAVPQLGQAAAVSRGWLQVIRAVGGSGQCWSRARS